jgi:hypothetical protein
MPLRPLAQSGMVMIEEDGAFRWIRTLKQIFTRQHVQKFPPPKGTNNHVRGDIPCICVAYIYIVLLSHHESC